MPFLYFPPFRRSSGQSALHRDKLRRLCLSLPFSPGQNPGRSEQASSFPPEGMTGQSPVSRDKQESAREVLVDSGVRIYSA